MREIKFEAITLEGNIIRNIGTIEFFTDGQIIVNEEFPVKCLRQYTGLKDKNGKEIYEGDIVERVYDFTKSNKPLKTIDQIIYEDNWGSFAFMNKTKIGQGYSRIYNGQGYSRIYSGHKVFPFEVIGNIYESKHLLDNTDTKV